MSRFYSFDGEPLTMREWERVPKGTRRYVAWDEVDDVIVSTVYLGLDHRFGKGPPLIFETMVFGGDDDEYLARYSTVREAQEGHRRIVEAVRRGERLGC